MTYENCWTPSKAAIGLLLVCLVALLTGCASNPPVIQTETITIKPPAALVQPTPEPVLTGDTNGALLDWATELREALRACNADKRALQSFADKL